MKYSYKVLKSYLPFLESGKQVADDIIMHTAEVEEIHSKKKDFENIVYGKITKIEAHPDANALRVCMVDVGESEDVQIVCGGSNLEVNQGVAVAKIGASVLWHGQGEPVIMKKTSIRGVDSYGMICASEEIGLKTKFPAKDEKEILDLSSIKAKVGTNLAEVLNEDDEIIEIDNKGINHRPDMFSYVGIARELAVINGQKIGLEYEKNDFSKEKDLGIKNEIPEVVKRYIGLKVYGVSNIDSPDEVKQVVEASGNNSKGLLVDISNYSLYLYGQPTHCFDADKIIGNIVIRFAKNDEEFIALDGKTYKLSIEDIVIADSEKVLALGGVIGGALSAVSDTTKSVVIEGANFNPKTVRKTGRRHGIRTDSLNVFEKDIPTDLSIYGVSLIYRNLKNLFPDLKIEGFSDIYPKNQEVVKVPFDLNFINNLIGAKYNEKEALEILEKLGLKLDGKNLVVPFYRTDLHYKADIAEEVARINGLNNIETTIPRINLGAIIQDNIYKLKNDIRDYFVDRGFFDMYNYSFVNEELMKKVGGNTENLVPLKNSLSEDMTHMRGSLIPNLMLSLEKNIRQKQDLKLFEFEKVFKFDQNKVLENYNISGVITSERDMVYYDLQKVISDLFKKIGVDNYMFQTPKNYPTFVHKGRTASIVVRGQEIGFIGEIHPFIAKSFDISSRVGFFEIDADKLKNIIYNKVKAREVSQFQENNFDLSFVVPKDLVGKDIFVTIAKTDTKVIQKVELFDIYENEDKLPGKRSLSFKIFIQSLDETLSDETKNNLIKSIIERVARVGGVLR
nr:phenylalanine--tRNA ligase subunit beta [Candidatus Gracilibacteria bacterium]